jgi:hypothetical protein
VTTSEVKQKIYGANKSLIYSLVQNKSEFFNQKFSLFSHFEIENQNDEECVVLNGFFYLRNFLLILDDDFDRLLLLYHFQIVVIHAVSGLDPGELRSLRHSKNRCVSM